MTRFYSFDLFDTLVTRKVNHPKDVFTIVEATGIVKFRFFLDFCIDFKSIRVLSEKIARFINRNKKEDINIFDIYRVLGFFVKNPRDVLVTEIEVELSLIIPLTHNIEILNRLLDEKKTVFIISDMYLPKFVLKKILEKNKIKMDSIYVSSEVGLTKATGNLFKYIADLNKIKISDIMHYGDNLHSDIAIPKKLGMQAVHVGTPLQRQSSGFLDTFRSPIQDDPYYKIGYEFCGKIAYAFATYIKNNVEKNQNIVFASRDSYLFKKYYEFFYNQDKAYNTFYTRISRKIVYLPEIYYSGNIQRLFQDTVTCDDFFLRLELKCPSYLKGKNLWDHKKEVEEIIRSDDGFLHQIGIKSIEIKKYLSKNGFDSDVIFIDMGWKGSTQDALNVIFDKEIKVTGLYIGVVNNSKDKSGLLFQVGKKNNNFFHIMQCVALFEYLFTEPVLSLSDVIIEDNEFKYLYTNDESLFQIENRKQIQKGSEDFLQDFYELSKKNNFDEKMVLDSVDSLIQYHTMIVHNEYVKAFEGLTHSGGFNGSQQSSMIEFKNFSILGYLEAPWKAYFMAELKKESQVRYLFFRVFFHNVVFFIFYHYFKILYRKVRAILND